MVSNIATFMANLDPHYRLQSERINLNGQINLAKLQQQERHHNEMLAFHRQRMQMEQQKAEEQNQSLVLRELIAGKNALQLSEQQAMFSHFENNSQLLNNHYMNNLERRREWENNITEIQRSLLEIEADTIRQRALSKQEHQQTMERMRLEAELRQKEQTHISELSLTAEKLKMKQEMEKLILEYNMKFLEAELNNYLQNKRITYDSLNNIIMQLIERVVGLGEQVNSNDIERFVNEAMQQL